MGFNDIKTFLWGSFKTNRRAIALGSSCFFFVVYNGCAGFNNFFFFFFNKKNGNRFDKRKTAAKTKLTMDLKTAGWAQWKEK